GALAARRRANRGRVVHRRRRGGVSCIRGARLCVAASPRTDSWPAPRTGGPDTHACATAQRRTTVVITEVRIKLMEDNNERLQAFCSVTFDDCFVIRDLKIIEGTKGSFVAMPSRKLTDRCPGCGSKNHLRAR